MVDLVKPNWPAPTNIKAYTTTRNSGYSEAPFDTFNTADHVGDKTEDVATNRHLLLETLDLKTPPLWLNQTHSDRIVCADCPSEDLSADASYAKLANKICVVQTADCLPLLFTNEKGSIVAAVHAGWRGLTTDIIAKTVKLCEREKSPIMVWLGPAIGAEAYEVGNDVRDAFIKLDNNYTTAFKPAKENHWYLDIYSIARMQLNALGITEIYGGELCTYTDKKRFFSYRRDGQTGRMATLIWMSPGI